MAWTRVSQALGNKAKFLASQIKKARGIFYLITSAWHPLLSSGDTAHAWPPNIGQGGGCAMMHA
jgi:hypothetical protein